MSILKSFARCFFSHHASTQSSYHLSSREVAGLEYLVPPREQAAWRTAPRLRMTAGAAEPSPPLDTMAIPGVEYIVPPLGFENGLDGSPSSPRTFKTHKNLPHPRNGSVSGSVLSMSDSRRSSVGTARYVICESKLREDGSGLHVASLHTLRHQRRSISGGDLPPTPPAHSRNSSSSHSVALSNLSPLQTPAQSSEDVKSKASPSTPPNQRSPPTPEVTPPQTEYRPKASQNSSRPLLPGRFPSRSTTASRTESRTESFRTALESPVPSDGEESRSTVRSPPLSARTSRNTIRLVKSGGNRPSNRAESSRHANSEYQDEPQGLIPKGKVDFSSFDGEWASASEVEQEWDDNLARDVTVKRRRPTAHSKEQRHEFLDDRTVSPTNATRAQRAIPLQGRVLTYDSSEPRRSVTAPEAAATESPSHGHDRRLSGMSSKSTASTVVEAILVETTPRRQKTLRHVRRVDALRDSVWQSSPQSSAPSLRESGPRRRQLSHPRETTRESYASSSTVNSISSRKARREIWKAGAIPVVVVPDRHSSTRSTSQDRSLRSTSSQRSKRSNSNPTVPPLPQIPNQQDLTSYFDRPARRDRRTSEPDGSTPGDQRTMDFPPVVPRRTSSLSAPTSRNGSRSASITGSRRGSLTAESLRAHDSVIAASSAHASNREPSKPASSRTATSVPAVTVNSAPSYDQLKPDVPHQEIEDRKHLTSEGLLGSPMSTHATPFSQTSQETAAEIAQALAISIMPHKNRSVVMVDHRPSESSDGERKSQAADRPGRPIITTTEFQEGTEEGPVTPSQEQRDSLGDDMDSPLRNPRAPPEPPALRLIAATPSGLTPAEEKPRLLGNLYDDEKEDEREKSARGLEFVRRALGRRRHSYGPSPARDVRPGFLTRTLSLSRNTRRDPVEEPEDEDGRAFYDEPLPDDSRLHPHWRPSYYAGYHDDMAVDSYEMDDDDERHMHYPPIDNRPRPPKRSLSQRMKRTFAIMPLQDDAYSNDTMPERRTIRRTPSGNLRVVKHRGSAGSLRNRQKDSRPATAPEPPPRRVFFPRSYRSMNLVNNKIRNGVDASKTNAEPQHQNNDHNGLRRSWSLTRRLSEKRREKRSNELRQKISGPLNVRDGVNDIIRRGGPHEAYQSPREMKQHSSREQEQAGVI